MQQGKFILVYESRISTSRCRALYLTIIRLQDIQITAYSLDQIYMATSIGIMPTLLVLSWPDLQARTWQYLMALESFGRKEIGGFRGWEGR